MKKKKIVLIIVVAVCIIFIILYYFKVKNNIIFHTFDKEITVLWGQNLNEKKDEFYHLEKNNIDTYVCNLIYDENKINQVQKLTVEVKYLWITTKKTFKLIIVDEDKPVIKYNNEKKEVDENFDIEEYLEVYDQRRLDGEKIYLSKQEDNTAKYYNKGGYYYYNEGQDSEIYSLEKGLNNIHVIAWDGHGNENEKVIRIYVD